MSVFQRRRVRVANPDQAPKGLKVCRCAPGRAVYVVLSTTGTPMLQRILVRGLLEIDREFSDAVEAQTFGFAKANEAVVDDGS